MKLFIAGLAAVAMAVTIVPSASAAGSTQLTGVRTEHYATYDRVVFDLTGSSPQPAITRTTELENCASGKPISAVGAEFLEVRMQPADGTLYGGSRNITTGLPTAQSVAFTCDFEADLSIAIGVNRSNATYTAHVESSPLRYVVDIYHS
ncbi:MAG TPA: hypothetical protein VF821_26300 [Lentzea sp.]